MARDTSMTANRQLVYQKRLQDLTYDEILECNNYGVHYIYAEGPRAKEKPTREECLCFFSTLTDGGARLFALIRNEENGFETIRLKKNSSANSVTNYKKPNVRSAKGVERTIIFYLDPNRQYHDSEHIEAFYDPSLKRIINKNTPNKDTLFEDELEWIKENAFMPEIQNTQDNQVQPNEGTELTHDNDLISQINWDAIYPETANEQSFMPSGAELTEDSTFNSPLLIATDEIMPQTKKPRTTEALPLGYDNIVLNTPLNADMHVIPIPTHGTTTTTTTSSNSSNAGFAAPAQTNNATMQTTLRNGIRKINRDLLPLPYHLLHLANEVKHDVTYDQNKSDNKYGFSFCKTIDCVGKCADTKNHKCASCNQSLSWYSHFSETTMFVTYRKRHTDNIIAKLEGKANHSVMHNTNSPSLTDTTIANTVSNDSQNPETQPVEKLVEDVGTVTERSPFNANQDLELANSLVPKFGITNEFNQNNTPEVTENALLDWENMPFFTFGDR